jgi:hypothetical protein
MNVNLSFVTNPALSAKRGKAKSKKVKRTLVKFKSDHTPIEIQNMDNQELEYLYEHGSPTEKDMAENILHARKKWSLVELAMPMDAELASGTGSPYAGGVRY